MRPEDKHESVSVPPAKSGFLEAGARQAQERLIPGSCAGLGPPRCSVNFHWEDNELAVQFAFEGEEQETGGCPWVTRARDQPPGPMTCQEALT